MHSSFAQLSRRSSSLALLRSLPLSPLSLMAYPGQPPFQQPQYAPNQPQYAYAQQSAAPPGGPIGGSPLDAQSFHANREEQLMQAFKAVCDRYEISEYFARKLKQLEGWEIVLILDDSGSMNTPLKDQGGASAFAKSITRWDELKVTTSIIVDIGAVMDKDGERTDALATAAREALRAATH